jgi:serine phosphatase RsbU (regulator of sigma subunit)
LTVVITDVSGKGIGAAILASILQGLIYSQVVARVPLAEIATSANRFLCQRVQGEKYATVVILRMAPSGEMELVNCGHVPPLMVAKGKSQRLHQGGLPIGLLPDSEYSSQKFKLGIGDRVVLVTDGVTEAENKDGDMFGEDRLEETALQAEESCFELVFAAVKKFCGDTPLNDDCTLLELIYKGRPGYRTEPTMSIPAQE